MAIGSKRRETGTNEMVGAQTGAKATRAKEMDGDGD